MNDWMKTAAEVQAEARVRMVDQERAEARRYLAETDWYVIRAHETGAPIPDQVAQNRAAARKGAGA